MGKRSVDDFKKIGVKDLEPGDILLFSGPKIKEKMVSEAIKALTCSDVCHAALYIGNKMVIESLGGLKIKNGVCETNIEKYIGIQDIYVKRLIKKPSSMEPVIRMAQRYKNDKRKYAYGQVAVLAVLLLLDGKEMQKKITNTKLVEDFIILALKLFKGKEPLMCSELVFECFEKAGIDYELKIENGILSGKTRVETMEEMSLPQECLFEKAVNYFVEHPNVQFRSLEFEAQLLDEDELLMQINEVCRQMVNELEEDVSEEQIEEGYEEMELDEETAGYIIQLADALGIAYEMPGKKIRMEGLAKEAGKVWADFVTPEDLFSNCINIEFAGVIESNI